MGTRNLTIVLSDGTHKVAQYGQFDGYPSGQGLTALRFAREHLSNDNGRAAFKEKLKNARFVSEDEHNAFYKKAGIEVSPEGWIKWDDSKKFAERYPSLHRDTGAGVLSIIANSTEEVPLTDASEFVEERSCEWTWTISLDTNKLIGEGYTSATFSLDDLPSDEDFLKAFKKEEDDDDGTSSDPKTWDELETRLNAAGFESYTVETDNHGQLIIYTGLVEQDGKLVPLE